MGVDSAKPRRSPSRMRRAMGSVAGVAGCLLVIGLIVVLAPLLLVIVLFVVMPALNPGPGTVAQLEALPETTLAYPGAVRLSADTQPAYGTITGPGAAKHRSRYVTQDSPASVFAWYADQLRSPRWVEGVPLYNTLDLTDLRAWCSETADARLQVAFYDASDARFEAGEYEVFLRATESDYECTDRGSD